MSIKNYETPDFQQIELVVEQGFAASSEIAPTIDDGEEEF